jgi:hypothetical protein
VQALPLSPSSIDYYQVYFSVLAALGPRDQTYCPKALEIAAQVEASPYITDRPDIVSNMAVARQECSGEASAPVAVPETPSTPEPNVTPSFYLTPYATP